MTPTRIMVVDDHGIIGQGLKVELQQFGIDAVNITTDGALTVANYLESKPDVLVLDVKIGSVDGLDVANAVLALDPKANIVFYSQFDQGCLIQKAYRIGAKAYISKSAELSDLCLAIESAKEGKLFISEVVSRQLALLSITGHDSPQEKLSEREMKVFRLMAMGYTIAEVAVALDISFKSANLIIHSVKALLDVDRQPEITKLAVKHGLITADD